LRGLFAPGVELALRRLVANQSHLKGSGGHLLISVVPGWRRCAVGPLARGLRFETRRAYEGSGYRPCLWSRMLARQARASSWSSIDGYETSSWRRFALKKIQYPLTRQLWR